jgi:DNA modification methylase
MASDLIIEGDARHLKQLGFKAGSVDCFVTSPPYFNLKRYSDAAEAELGQGQARSEYLADLEAILGDCFELAKDTGVLWLIVDTLREPVRGGGLGQMIPLPFQIAEAAQRAGWRFQEVVIWRKNKTLPYSGQGKLRNLIEYVLLMTKGQNFKHRPFRLAERHGSGAEWLSGWPERYHPLGRRPSNIWKIPIPTQGMWAHGERLHFCPLPQDLVARCIELTTDKGDLVVDPFAGIGTVPAQAEAMGRRGQGVELNPDFISIFEKQTLPQFQAAWEKAAEHRAMNRRDQARETETILRLRCLKAGKELSRLLERWTHDRPGQELAGAVGSVLVDTDAAGLKAFDADEGTVSAPLVTLRVLADAEPDQREILEEELVQELGKPPFSTFGLQLRLTVESRQTALPQVKKDLHRFEQSRRASYTEPITSQTNLPRLVTTIPLTQIVRGDKSGPLELAREEAERRIVAAEWERSQDRGELAERLGITEFEAHDLLLRHGIAPAEETFVIPLQLSRPSVDEAPA